MRVLCGTRVVAAPLKVPVPGAGGPRRDPVAVVAVGGDQEQSRQRETCGRRPAVTEADHECPAQIEKRSERR